MRCAQCDGVLMGAGAGPKLVIIRDIPGIHYIEARDVR